VQSSGGDGRPNSAIVSREEVHMTIIWFIVWLIANNVGGHEVLVARPVNAWLATLILAVALDLNTPKPYARRR
jgi:hypothetical protein